MTRKFSNLDVEHRFHDARSILRWGVWDRLTGRRRVEPAGPPAPWMAPDLGLIRSPGGPPRLTWIGHASFLGTLGGRSFAIDPVFSARVGWLCPRYGEPGLRPEQLPPLSALLITHNHYDHLDRASLGLLPRDVPAVVPRGLGRWFRRWNPRPTVELDWWQSARIDGLGITLIPGRHWSRRWVADFNRTLWGGYVVEGGGVRVYHAGDSALFDGFAEVGCRFPGLAAALLPIGAYSPGWFMERQHMSPEQAGQAFLTLAAARLVPMHWGAFQLTDEPIAEPIARLDAWWDRQGPRDGRRLVKLAVGETLVLEESAGAPEPGAAR